MSKFVFFLFLIHLLLIKTKKILSNIEDLTDEEEEMFEDAYFYIKSVNNEIKNAFEDKYYSYVSFLQKSIFDSKFELNDKKDILGIKIFDLEEEVEDFIIFNLTNNFGLTKSDFQYREIFSNIVTKNFGNQWKKFDLIFSLGQTVSSISVFQKFYDYKFILIYFSSLKKLKFQGKFILINRSIDYNNPFNNIFDPSILIIDRKFRILKEDEILVKYFSVLSYNAFGHLLNLEFILPDIE